MKKVVCFGLCFLIVLCSFVMCFAAEWQEEGSSPSILPVGDPSFPVVMGNGVTYYFSASSSPVYIVSWATSSSGLHSPFLLINF